MRSHIHHSNNPNPCMLSCLSNLDYCNSLLSGCPQYLLDKLQKVQNAAAWLSRDQIWPHPSYSSSSASHTIQYFNYLLQFHLWSSPSISVRSPSTLYSSKTIMICIWHMNLCHPSCNTKTCIERSFSYTGPSVCNNLPQTLSHSDSASSFKATLKMHLFNNYF